MLEAGTYRERVRVYQVITTILVVLVGILAWMALTTEPQEPRVITLTHTACQFLEPETQDHGYSRRTRNDCIRTNNRTRYARKTAMTPLRIEEGKYTFKVRNRDVPAELGFWLRTEGFDIGNPFDHFYRMSVSGGGIGEGETRTFTVTLNQGTYIYEGPLNPTLGYKLIVTR